ncbi:TIGR04438 family Trp-rich protein [Caldimonas sp. KR1-144]|uniref:TIGR04438 family Trp-rich protein n=1 Tax=Caldimonas sp. KR1-144 TaxID=3400911 RepID=UPI003BFCED0D
MLFIVVGVLLVLLKLLDFGAPAAWPWWAILSPFILAALWWWWSDASGRTKRLEMEKMDDRKEERRRKNLAALGIDYRAHSKQKKQAEKFKAMRKKEVAEVEGKREAQRQKFKDSILHSRLDSSQSTFENTQQPPAEGGKS